MSETAVTTEGSAIDQQAIYEVYRILRRAAERARELVGLEAGKGGESS